ncbi:hypothetical protein QJS10_CPB18g00647 [Acorus calamus]|uniref:Uncharacterized protein n=1 Tax=Acorus calamus TaxID=4465 RepID=A0AAV9CNS4_ACOCL|nr:hypothetical protein QJS10_CPB18g00647 [Acorus calamus]
MSGIQEDRVSALSSKGAIDLCVAQMKNVLSAQQLPLNASMEILGRAYYATKTFVQAKWAPLSPPSKMSGENWVDNGEESRLVAGGRFGHRNLHCKVKERMEAEVGKAMEGLGGLLVAVGGAHWALVYAKSQLRKLAGSSDLSINSEKSRDADDSSSDAGSSGINSPYTNELSELLSQSDIWLGRAELLQSLLGSGIVASLDDIADKESSARLRDRLIEDERYNMAIYTCKKCKIDSFTVWNAWGHALIRVEHYAQASVKFKQAFQLYKGDPTPVILEIINELEGSPPVDVSAVRSMLISEGKLADALALSDRCLNEGASDELLQLLVENGEEKKANFVQHQGYGSQNFVNDSWQYCLRLKDKHLAARLALKYLHKWDLDAAMDIFSMCGCHLPQSDPIRYEVEADYKEDPEGLALTLADKGAVSAALEVAESLALSLDMRRELQGRQLVKLLTADPLNGGGGNLRKPNRGAGNLSNVEHSRLNSWALGLHVLATLPLPWQQRCAVWKGTLTLFLSLERISILRDNNLILTYFAKAIAPNNLQKVARRAFSWAPRDSGSKSTPKEVYRKRKSSGFAPTERVDRESMSGIQEDRVSVYSTEGQERLPSVSIAEGWVLSGDPIKDDAVRLSHRYESSPDVIPFKALLSLCSDELIYSKGAIDLCVAQMKNVLSAQQLPLHASMEILGQAYYATETFVHIYCFPAWNAWGHALILVEPYAQARVKFKHACQLYKGDPTPVIPEIINELEGSPPGIGVEDIFGTKHVNACSLKYEHLAKSAPTILDDSLSVDSYLNVLYMASTFPRSERSRQSQEVSNPQYSSNSEFDDGPRNNLDNMRYIECINYFKEYARQLMLGFMFRHGHYTDACMLFFPPDGIPPQPLSLPLASPSSSTQRMDPLATYYGTIDELCDLCVGYGAMGILEDIISARVSMTASQDSAVSQYTASALARICLYCETHRLFNFLYRFQIQAWLDRAARREEEEDEEERKRRTTTVA